MKKTFLAKVNRITWDYWLYVNVLDIYRRVTENNLHHHCPRSSL